MTTDPQLCMVEELGHRAYVVAALCVIVYMFIIRNRTLVGFSLVTLYRTVYVVLVAFVKNVFFNRLCLRS